MYENLKFTLYYCTIADITKPLLILYQISKLILNFALAKYYLRRPYRNKSTKDRSNSVNHIKKLIDNVVAQEQEEVKLGDLQKTIGILRQCDKGSVHVITEQLKPLIFTATFQYFNIFQKVAVGSSHIIFCQCKI